MTTNKSGTSELFNECALFNSEGTSMNPLDNNMRDTNLLKADEFTLDASISAELDSSFDQSYNELFKEQDDQKPLQGQSATGRSNIGLDQGNTILICSAEAAICTGTHEVDANLAKLLKV